MHSKELQEDLCLIADYIDSLGIADSSILITGATGLIGSLLVKSFMQYNKTHTSNIEVIAMARNFQKVQDIYPEYFSEAGLNTTQHIRFVYQDIRDEIPDDLHCDYIIHTASPTESKFFITHPVEVIDSICIGTKRILEFAHRKKAKGVVYLSSMEVYGQTDNSTAKLSEDDLGYLDIQNVRSSYPEAKRLAECLCKAYAIEYGLPVKVARLAQTFGPGILPGENRVFAQFAKSVIYGNDIVLHTEGSSYGNYCYTVDALTALILLLKTGDSGEAYNVVNEDSTMSIREMAEMVANEVAYGRIKVRAEIPQGIDMGYSPESKMRLSAKKLQELGWKPQISLYNTYCRMIQEMKDR